MGKDNLKKGDLVFFKTTRSDRISHVGIYIGEGKFVHASSGGGKVRVNNLSDGYYSKRFAGAKRVAKADEEGSSKAASKSKDSTKDSSESHAEKSEKVQDSKPQSSKNTDAVGR